MNVDDAVCKDGNVFDQTCLLETYLSELHIWQQLSALASEHPLPVQRSVAHAHATGKKLTLMVCVVPASRPAWPWEVRPHAPPPATGSAQSCSNSPLGVGVGVIVGNLRVPQGKEEEYL